MTLAGSGGRSSWSTPAWTALRAASSVENDLVTPAISRASVTMRPRKPIFCRRTPVMMGAESVAGRPGVGSRAGTARWALMTALTPASTADWKG